MKLAVLTCAAFPSEGEARRKLWIFLRSCEKFNIDPILYGMGTQQFPGYKRMMLDMQLDALQKISNSFTHVLFTDGWDAFFTTGLEEILFKYDKMGRPDFLASAYIGLGNESDMSKYEGCFDESKTYRYPNRGGYLAELPTAIWAFQRMVDMPHQTGDDCFNWYEGWREGWFRPTLDHNCEIFQVSDVNAKCEMRFSLNAAGERTTEFKHRVFNTVTGSNPCILHLSGGYADPETGKDETLKPWARALGVI
jgi:hypothetical protein